MKSKSNISKQHDAHAKMGLRDLCKPKKKAAPMEFADGGLVSKRLQTMETLAGAAPQAPAAPAPTAPAPAAAAPAPASVMSPEEVALRRKNGMAVPGEAPPSLMQSVRKKIGFADGGRVSLRQAMRAGQRPGEVKGPGGPVDDKIDAKLSDGEYVIPADTVEQIGVEALDDLVAQTHTPAHAQKDGYANGGRVNHDDMNDVTRTSLERFARGQGAARDIEKGGRTLRDLPFAFADTFTGLAGAAAGTMVDMPRYQMKKNRQEKAQSVQDNAVRGEHHFADGGLVMPEEGMRQFPKVDAIPRPEGLDKPYARDIGRQPGVPFTPEARAHVEATRVMPGAVPAPAVAPPAAPGLERAAPGEAPPRPTLRQVAPNVERMIDATKSGAQAAYRGAGGARGIAQGAAKWAAPAVELARLSEVTENPNATKLDAANQFVSGASRGLGAFAGGTIGAAMGGPVGAALGGTIGYVVPDQAIKFGRKMFGTEVSDPVDRLAAEKQARQEAMFKNVESGSSTTATGPAAPQEEQQPQQQVQPQPTLRDDPGISRRERQIAIYGDPNRYSPEAIAAEHEAISAKYRVEQPKGFRTFGDLRDERRNDALNVEGAKLAAEQGKTRATLRGQNMTAQQAQAKLAQDQAAAARDQANKDREYGLNRDKHTAEYGTKQQQEARATEKANQEAEKALHERVGTMIPPGPDNKPDTAKAAKYATGLNAVRGEEIAKTQAHLAKNPGDARAKAYLAQLNKGVGGLGDDAIRRFVVGMEAAETAKREHSGWNPWGGTAVEHDAPVTSMKRKTGFFRDYYETNRGDEIPAKAVESKDGLRNRNFEILRKDK